MKTHIDEAMKLIKVLHILLRFHDLNVHVRLVHAKHSVLEAKRHHDFPILIRFVLLTFFPRSYFCVPTLFILVLLPFFCFKSSIQLVTLLSVTFLIAQLNLFFFNFLFICE